MMIPWATEEAAGELRLTLRVGPCAGRNHCAKGVVREGESLTGSPAGAHEPSAKAIQLSHDNRPKRIALTMVATVSLLSTSAAARAGRDAPIAK